MITDDRRALSTARFCRAGRLATADTCFQYITSCFTRICRVCVCVCVCVCVSCWFQQLHARHIRRFPRDGRSALAVGALPAALLGHRLPLARQGHHRLGQGTSLAILCYRWNDQAAIWGVNVGGAKASWASSPQENGAILKTSPSPL